MSGELDRGLDKTRKISLSVFMKARKEGQMVRSIFAKQDKANLDSLVRAAAISHEDPNTIFLQIWTSNSLPYGWLGSLSFDLIHCDGTTIRCNAYSFGLNDSIVWYCLKPEDQAVDLHAIFAVPGKDFNLTLQYVEAITPEGPRKRLLNRTYADPRRTQRPGQ